MTLYLSREIAMQITLSISSLRRLRAPKCITKIDFCDLFKGIDIQAMQGCVCAVSQKIIQISISLVVKFFFPLILCLIISIFKNQACSSSSVFVFCRAKFSNYLFKNESCLFVDASAQNKF